MGAQDSSFELLLQASRFFFANSLYAEGHYALQVAQVSGQFTDRQKSEAAFCALVGWVRYHWERLVASFESPQCNAEAFIRAVETASSFAVQKKEIEWHRDLILETTNLCLGQGATQLAATILARICNLGLQESEFGSSLALFKLVFAHVQLISGSHHAKLALQDATELVVRHPTPFLSLYHSLLTLTQIHRSGDFNGANEALHTLRTGLASWGEIEKATNAIGLDVTWLKWVEMGTAFLGLFSGIELQNSGDVCGALQCFTNEATSLSACLSSDTTPLNHLLGEAILFEIQAQTATCHLIQCNYYAALKVLTELTEMVRRTSESIRQHRLMTLHMLVGHYSMGTQSIDVAVQHFDASLRYASQADQECYVELQRFICRPEDEGSRPLTEIAEKAAARGLVQVRTQCLVIEGIRKHMEGDETAKAVLRKALQSANTEVKSPRIQAAGLAYLGRHFFSLNRGDPKAEEALSSALALAAKMKDVLSQLAILKLLKCVNRSNDAKLEKITGYQVKRHADLKDNIMATLSDASHPLLVSWDIKTS